MKKILGAVWKLPAKYHSQSSPFSPKLGWIGCAIQQVTSKRLPQFFSYFQDIFLNDFIKNPQTRNACAFLPLNISAVGSVLSLIYFYFSRNTLNEIYFGKTRDIVNGLRSVQPLDQSKQQDDLRKDLVIALASKNVTKAE